MQSPYDCRKCRFIRVHSISNRGRTKYKCSKLENIRWIQSKNPSRPAGILRYCDKFEYQLNFLIECAEKWDRVKDPVIPNFELRT